MRRIDTFFCCFIAFCTATTAIKAQNDTVIHCTGDMLCAKSVTLRIDRIKGRGTVTVNGQTVGTQCNEFVPFAADIKSLLRVGENRIAIAFDSLFKDTADFAQRYGVLSNEPRVLLRLAQYNFGWDFCSANLTPDFTGFRVMYGEDDATIPYYVVTDSVTNDTAYLTLHTESRKTAFQIPHPILWFPNGMGQQHIYQKRIDNMDIRFGIRTIQLVEETDSIGRSFYFKVNGLPFFAKGSNWIATPVTDTAQLAMAKAAHINMLRLWGGGRYADDRMLNWCDRNGILLWQDFPFACAPYPADSAFLNEIRAEAKANLDRLKCHPCVAVLCGNNEIWEGIHNWGWYQSAEDSIRLIENYNALFQRTLPQVISITCPNIPYIHTSPLYGWGRKESLTHADCHYWGVWWGDSVFETYTRKVGRFMSEYGFQSPVIPSSVWHGQYRMRYTGIRDKYGRFQHHPRGFESIEQRIEEWYGSYAGEDDFIRKANNVACAAYRIAIESHRRAMPKCMGSLTWQFNEPEIAFSWACIDAAGKPKPVYNTLKHCFEPLILSIDTYSSPDSVRIWYCNDGQQCVEAKHLNIVFLNDNEEIIHWQTLTDIRFNGMTSACIISLAYKDIPKFNRNRTFLRVSVPDPDLRISSSCFFCKPKDYVKPALYDSEMFE
ncbi:MAG: hypothetical protein LBR17_06140 [Bacteroidales bacterium]|jgi:beta-mannosidase|nr:hypothetical protein [Bacteroidales bacterium]